MTLALQTPFEPARLDEVRRLGLGAVQLRLGPGFPISTADPALEEARRAAGELRRRGLAVVALGYYRNLLAPDPAERRREISDLRRVMRMAALFATDLVGVFAGRDPERSIDDNLPRFAAVWWPLAAEAEALGVRLAFENCTMFKGYPARGINLCHTPYAYRRMFELVPSPSLGIELDPSHLWKQRIDPVGFVGRFPGRIFHLHAKDHERLPERLEDHGCFDPRVSRDRLPGEGEIDFAALFAALAAAGFRGDVTLELERSMLDGDPRERQEALARSVEFLRPLVAGLPAPRTAAILPPAP